MNPRPGVKTTEFWMHIVLQVILLLNTIGVWNYMPPKYTVLVQGILGAFYAFARGLAKISPPRQGPVYPITGVYPTTSTGTNYPIEPPGDTTEAPPTK